MRKINIAHDFSRYPAGRHLSDGPFSGEKFRNEFLLEPLSNNEHCLIELDGVRGYGSSFLEEAFGGLVREGKFEADDVLRLIELSASDESLIFEITEYIKSAHN